MTRGATCAAVAMVVCGRCNTMVSVWKPAPSFVSSRATVPSFGPDDRAQPHIVSTDSNNQQRNTDGVHNQISARYMRCSAACTVMA